MSILVDERTRVLVQGITGKEGGRATKEMLAYGTKVLAGVTPGKGGTTTEEGVPIFDSVKEALIAFPDVNAALVAVPGKFVGDAVEESIHAGIPFINILSERVPVHRVAGFIALARRSGTVIVGPSSVGVCSPQKGKIGSIGGGGLAKKIFSKGVIGVISKSGGMTAEISRILTEGGFGQSTAVGIGGDLLIGADFRDIAHMFEKDPETRVIVIFGEVGGTYEEQLADAKRNGEIKKPIIALIAGEFAEHLPIGTTLGHAGAIVEGGSGTAAAKTAALKQSGAHIAKTPEEIVAILKTILNHEI